MIIEPIFYLLTILTALVGWLNALYAGKYWLYKEFNPYVKYHTWLSALMAFLSFSLFTVISTVCVAILFKMHTPIIDKIIVISFYPLLVFPLLGSLLYLNYFLFKKIMEQYPYSKKDLVQIEKNREEYLKINGIKAAFSGLKIGKHELNTPQKITAFIIFTPNIILAIFSSFLITRGIILHQAGRHMENYLRGESRYFNTLRKNNIEIEGLQ